MRGLLVWTFLVIGTETFAGEWSKLPPLPDPEGFAGMYAGISHSALLVAGGTNFPEKKPWEGGKKAWYDHIFVLDRPNGTWKMAGKLPRPLGYGVSVTHGNSVVCVGGADADRHHTEVFRLEWREGKLITTQVPPLPVPTAFFCGGMIDDHTLYVVGGQEKPASTVALKTAFQLDLASSKPRWKRIEDLPGNGRILAAAAGIDGAFYVVGGAELIAAERGLAKRKYLRDGYRYDPGRGWTRLPDLPYPVVAAPSPMPGDKTGFYVLGGDDGSQVGVSPEKHRGFSRYILRFDLHQANWQPAGELTSSRVTVPCTWWNRSWILPSGEVRPGVRTPGVVSFSPGGTK